MQTQGLVRSFGCVQLDHPPYSSDFAPSNFHLFRFNDNGEVRNAFTDFASSLVADFFDVDI